MPTQRQVHSSALSWLGIVVTINQFWQDDIYYIVNSNISMSNVKLYYWLGFEGSGLLKTSDYQWYKFAIDCDMIYLSLIYTVELDCPINNNYSSDGSSVYVYTKHEL